MKGYNSRDRALAARPPSNKVMATVGIQPIAAGNLKWMDAVTIRGRLGREL